MYRYGICIIMNDEMQTIKNKHYFVLVLFDLKKQNCIDQYTCMVPVILQIDEFINWSH